MKTFYYGEQAVVLHVSYDTTFRSVHEIRSMYRALKAADHKGIVSVRPGLDCIVIEYEPSCEIDALLESLPVSESSEDNMNSVEPFVLPVCYEGDHGRDMVELEKIIGLKREEIVEIHTAATYEVWMIGFMPGFPYLGGLGPKLRVARKGTPDPLVPAGSVAIAEEFTGIYPADSPGGWHVIGRTPRKLVDYTSGPPWLFDYGMRVQIQAISAEEFDRQKTLEKIRSNFRMSQ